MRKVGDVRCHALLYWRPSCCILCVWNHALSRLPAIVAGLSAGVVWYISYYFLAGAPLRSSDRAGIWHPVVDDCELRGPLFGCQLDMRFFFVSGCVKPRLFDSGFGFRCSWQLPLATTCLAFLSGFFSFGFWSSAISD